eukprot:698746-Pyramimonas_sp.AAC.2
MPPPAATAGCRQASRLAESPTTLEHRLLLVTRAPTTLDITRAPTTLGNKRAPTTLGYTSTVSSSNNARGAARGALLVVTVKTKNK